LSRYDIAIGKKYSEPKDRKEKFADSFYRNTGSGVTARDTIQSCTQQRGIECQISVEGKEFTGRFLSLSSGQGQNDKDPIFNLAVELPIPIVNVNDFFKKIVTLRFRNSNLQTVVFYLFVQDISTETHDNLTIHISMSGIRPI
jgi:hypothetical protein